MKVKDLIQQLEGFEDFDIEAVTSKINDSEYGLTVETFKTEGITEIGYSEKLLLLSIHQED
jgi:hypothetical protein